MIKVVFSKQVKFKGEYLQPGAVVEVTNEELESLQSIDVVAHVEKQEKAKRQTKVKEEGE